MKWEMLSEFDKSRIKRWQIGMLTLALLCEMFLAADWYAFAAVIPFISETLTLDPAQAGLAQGIFALTYGLGMIVWSQVSRGMSARSMLLIGLAGTGIGMVLQVYVQNYGPHASGSVVFSSSQPCWGTASTGRPSRHREN